MVYSTKSGKREVIEYFSFLRVIACIEIIFLHSFSTSYSLYKDALEPAQRFISQIGALSFMWAVPIFVMVSGALLLNPNKEISIHTILFKYIKRMLIALVIFGLVFQIYDVLIAQGTLGVSTVIDGLKNIFQATSWAHLWYIYLLIGLYCMLPIFKGFIKSASDEELKFVLAILFIFLSGSTLLQIFNIPFGFYIHFSTIYPFYFLMGYALHSGKIEIKPIISIGMIMVGFVAIVWSIYGSVFAQWENTNVLWNYPSVPVVLESIGLFSLCTHIKKVHPVIHWIDGVSFGIYLIHMIFIRYILTKGIINPYQGGFLIQICIIATLSFGLSAFITFVLKKLPLFKNVL